MEQIVDSIKKLCDEMNTVYDFCYLGDGLTARSSCEVAFTDIVKINLVKFREYRDLLLGNRFLLQIKGKVIVVANDQQ